MAIYALDFDEIERARKELDQTASELQSNLDNCKSNLNSELSSWSGSASAKYNDQADNDYNTIAQDIDTIKGMSSYLGEVSTAVEATEDSLASLKI